MSFPSHVERSALSRRRVLTGVAFCGAASLFPIVPARASAEGATALPATPANRFSLTVEEVPVRIAGVRSQAIGINGSTPAPTLRWREGETVELTVHNRLKTQTSLHWHGIRLPADMDGVPGLSFAGIEPGAQFTYRFPVRQSGTYWYHSHSGFQEQTGLYGAIVIDPAGPPAHAADREHVVILSDWTDVDPADIVSNLKFQSDYYNFRQRTVGTFVRDARRDGLGAAMRDRVRWGAMNMAPTDISDVSGAIYTYLMNGQPPETGWTGLFRPGERVRLRFINAASMTLFDVRIPGLSLQVVGTDGNDVAAVPVDEFRIGPAETYDVIVRPMAEGPYTIFVQSEDRTGYARGTLAVREGVTAPVPPMDSRPLRTMADMGMGGMSHGAMGHEGQMPHDRDASLPDGGMSEHDMMDDMPGMAHGSVSTSEWKPKPGVETQSVAAMPIDRLGEPGAGLENNGRRVLTYADLRALRQGVDLRTPGRDIVLHLTGNMQRFIWGFDGRKFSEAGPIELALGERVRFVLVNDTMMEHPIHLHGLWSELENGHGDYRPYKHTITVKPGERLSFLVSADTPGMWAFHCHLLYHMEVGMFRTVVVS